jgi:TolB-like protein/tetratricopeptide (TPR) repeat protein
MVVKSNSPAPAIAPDVAAIRAQVEKILISSVFSRSHRLSRFLRFAVEQVLQGRGEELKEQLVGVEVFDRKPDYDPRIDPIVRVEARRLRGKLKIYYASTGRGDRMFIDFRKGTYVPEFRIRATGPAASRKAPVPKSIVVLPFLNLAPGAEDDYFSDGLVEELIRFLTRIPNFRVVAWNSASKMRGREQDLAGIRQQLKVETALRGSVRRTDGHVRVAAQLIDTETGVYLWSETYDREMQNIFAIQEEMARAIADALHLKLGPPTAVRSARTKPNLACYNLCLQGRYHFNKRTPEGLRKSVACFEQAILADESSADAYAGLADAYSLLVDYGLEAPLEAMPKARIAAERALELNPDSAEANVSLAYVRSLFEWKWQQAEALYRKAISLNPGYAQARHWFGLDFLALRGRLEEGLAQLRTAHDLDPLSLIIREGCGYVQILRRDYASALHTYRELVDLDPAFYKSYSSMGRAYFMMERFEEALESFETARRLSSAVPNILSGIGHTLGRLGRVPEARACLQELHRQARTGWVSAVCFAVVHLGLSEVEAALTWMETALARREISVTAFKIHPMYDPLRSQPRFQKILDQVGFLP